MGKISLPPVEFRTTVSHPDPKIFMSSGLEVVNILKQFGVVKNDSTILEIGSGPGRLALNLVHYIKKGSYLGVEIAKKYVDWCRENITKHYNNFQFKYVPIYNGEFNRDGIYKAHEYKFPFKDGSFSGIILHSVFTHMLPQDFENYIAEISRLLSKDGKCYASMFALDIQKRDMDTIPSVDSRHHFLIPIKRKGKYTGAWTTVISKPEAQTGYDINYINHVLSKNNLEIENGIKYGTWRINGKGLSNQDTLILVRSRTKNRSIDPYDFSFDYDKYITDWFKLRCIPTFRNALEFISRTLVKAKGKKVAIYGSGMPAIITYLANVYAGEPTKIVCIADNSKNMIGTMFMNMFKVISTNDLPKISPDIIILTQISNLNEERNKLKRFISKQTRLLDINEIIRTETFVDL